MTTPAAEPGTDPRPAPDAAVTAPHDVETDGPGALPALPFGAVESVTVARGRAGTCYRRPSCARCQDALDPVLPDTVGADGLWDSLQADGALILRVGGGYGMAIDPVGEPAGSLTVLVCGSCLPGLAAESPWLAPLLRHHGAPLTPGT